MGHFGVLKKILAVVSFATLSATAFGADGSSGCGVGWYLFKENSLLSSYSRSITNAVLPNTFSMTSGTSNCAKHSIVYNDQKGLHFVESNADSLEINVAAGSGQYLEGFALAMGCNQEVLPSFASALQSRYTEIYANQSSSPSEAKDSVGLYLRMKQALQLKDDVVQKCTMLSQPG